MVSFSYRAGCRPAYFSNLGGQPPRHSTVTALLERLGTSYDQYVLLSREEIEIAALQREITHMGVSQCKMADEPDLLQRVIGPAVDLRGIESGRCDADGLQQRGDLLLRGDRTLQRAQGSSDAEKVLPDNRGWPTTTPGNWGFGGNTKMPWLLQKRGGRLA